MVSGLLVKGSKMSGNETEKVDYRRGTIGKTLRNMKKLARGSRVWWCAPVILVTWEVRTGG